MEWSLEECISQALKLAQEEKLDDARAIADSLLPTHFDEIKVWMLRGYLNELGDEYEDAKSDYSRAIEINPSEPHLFFMRGKMHYTLNEFVRAVQDFDKGIELCDVYDHDYYRNELRIRKAAALLKLGDKPGAFDLLQLLPEGYGSWIDGLQTKQDLLSACL